MKGFESGHVSIHRLNYLVYLVSILHVLSACVALGLAMIDAMIDELPNG